MKCITALVSILLIIAILDFKLQDAPVFTAESVSSSESTAILSVTANDFSNIASGNLKILYDTAIAIPAAVTKGPGLTGTFDYNLKDPGVVRIGWFTYPAVSLTDGSVIFNIRFNKVSAGTSEVSFDRAVSDFDCRFYNGSHEKLFDEPFSKYYIPGTLTFHERTAPVVTAPSFTAASIGNIDVPITVTGFKNVGAVSLKLEYDPVVLNFNSADNTGGFPGMIIDNPTPGTLAVSGATNSPDGYSLPDETVFFRLNFTWLGGTTDLKWIDDGRSCEFAGPLSAYIYADTPQQAYYINGTVGPLPAPAAPSVNLIHPSCEVAAGTIEITAPLGEEYMYSLDGTSYQSSPVFTGLTSGSYSVMVKNSTGCISPATTAVIKEQPLAPACPVIKVTDATCEDSGSADITNYNPAYIYTFSPAGPSAEAGGEVTGLEPGRPYTVTAYSTGGCVSAPSEAFSIEDALEAPMPEITPDGPVELYAGESILLTAGEGESYLWSTGETSQNIVVAAAGEYTVEVTYKNGCSATSAPVTVTLSPTPNGVISIEFSPDSPVEVNHPVNLTVFYKCSLPADITVKWDDETTETFPDVSSGVLNATHVYQESGIYTITVEATDAFGNTSAPEEKTVVVYNPAGGFITGGGWFISIPDAVKGFPEESGSGIKKSKQAKNFHQVSHSEQKAHFSFAVKYQKGKTIPAGNVQFHLEECDFKFSGTTIDWMIISGRTHARIQGSGTLNGSGNYGFLITATDGLKSSGDEIRIKIWDKDDNNAVLYDNLTETNITGSIVIHTQANKSAALPGQPVKQVNSKVELKVYPNPFSEYLRIEFRSPESANACLDIYDIDGRLIKSLLKDSVEAGLLYQADFWPENRTRKVYLYKLIIGNRTYSGKVLYNKQ